MDPNLFYQFARDSSTRATVDQNMGMEQMEVLAVEVVLVEDCEKMMAHWTHLSQGRLSLRIHLFADQVLVFE